MKYYDLDIWIEARADDHYPTKASFTSMGENRGKLPVEAVDKIRAAQEELTKVQADESYLKEVGGALFAALFADGVGIHYQQALGQVNLDDYAGVRIRLRIESPDIFALPWELLYDANRDCFLATSSKTLLTRYIEINRIIKALETELPIKILVVIPQDSGLDVEHEKQTILTSLAGLKSAIEVCVLEGKVTSKAIRKQLVLDQFHIFHFIGHGGFANDKGCLVLNAEENGENHLVTAKQFAYHFQDYPWMKLVVLNSCSGAESSTQSLTGMAHELVSIGVPAVIAMREEISDEAAKLFADSFYEKLCLGYERGRVDIAVAHARKVIIAESTELNEFANPTLFMRSPDGILFDLGEDKADTDVRELHRLNAVTRTHDYNLAQIKEEGGEQMATAIAEEIQAKSKVTGRISHFYRRVAISAAPRVLALIVALAFIVAFASYTNLLNVFRVDDYMGGALRLLAGNTENPLNPKVKVILAQEGENGTLGNPKENFAWRRYHANLIDALTAANAKVIAFDLTFDTAAPEYDAELAQAIRRAQSNGVQVVGAQIVDDFGRPSSELNSELKPFFGSYWGDVNVGGQMDLPLLLGKSKYIAEYKIASLPLNGTNAGGEQSVTPSLALQAAMQKVADKETNPAVSFDEGAGEVILRAVSSGKPIEQHIPVKKNYLSLDMLMEYVHKQDLDNSTSNYKDIHALATSSREPDKAELKRRFENAVVIIGFNTAADTHTVFGGVQVSGTEIHANAVSNILNNIYVSPISRGADFLIIVLLIVTGVLIQTRLRKVIPTKLSLELPYIGKKKVPVVLFAVMVVYFVGAYLVYARGHVSFDMSYHLAALLFGYWLVSIFRKRLRLT